MQSTTCKLVIKFHSHISWLDASKQAMNSATMVEEAMIVCLTDFQEIDLSANIKMYLDVEHLLSSHPT